MDVRAAIEQARAVASEGHPIPLLAIGVAAGDEIVLDPDTDAIFEIGSVTKTLTATLLAAMCERTELALDDPIERHLPDGVPGRGITLLHLATHSSGLGRLPPNILEGGLDESNPYAHFTIEMLWDAVRRAELDAAPGERARYSNFGYGLLSQILARAGGAPFDALLQARVLSALGMTETWRRVPPAHESRFVEGHGEDGSPSPHWDQPVLAGSGGIRSTARDLLTYLRAELEPGSSPIGGAIELTQRIRMPMNERMSVCLGWHTFTLSGGAAFHWHNGGTGGFSSFVAFDRARGAACVLLGNRSVAKDLDVAGAGLMQALAGAR